MNEHFQKIEGAYNPYSDENSAPYYGRGLLSMNTNREARYSAEFAEFVEDGVGEVRRQWAEIHRVTWKDRQLHVGDLWQIRRWLVERPGGWAYDVFDNAVFFRFERVETAMEFTLIWTPQRGADSI